MARDAEQGLVDIQALRVALNPGMRIYLRDEIRDARALAQGDAEAFDEILFAVERLGSLLSKKTGSLKRYGRDLGEFARASALAEEVPQTWKELHTPFPRLYELMRNARNAALHQGAFARHLTGHAVEVALVLEDALMSEMATVGDFMVRTPVCAELWHPLSFVRHTMLANSFSFLPVRVQQEWCLISDSSLANYLRGVEWEERKERLAESLETAVQTGALEPEKALTFSANTSVAAVLPKVGRLPVLVLREGSSELIGILTAFDLL